MMAGDLGPTNLPAKNGIQKPVSITWAPDTTFGTWTFWYTRSEGIALRHLLTPQKLPSNIILAITIGTVLATLCFGRSKMDWAIPLMLSISASPVFEPKRFNIALTSATCTTMLIGNAANIVWVSHAAIWLAAACMLLAFAKYGWLRQPGMPLDKPKD
jgi:hypothetical protein